MNKFMTRYAKTVLSLIMAAVLLSGHDLWAQGRSRSSGIGVRASFWKLVSISGSDIETGNAGGWIYYFTRMRDNSNWFFEFSLGAMAVVHERNRYFPGNADATAVIPFLFGGRYDLSSTRYTGAFQPYFSFGGGPHWVTSATEMPGFQETLESGIKPGGYAGVGTNVAFTSWFAMNFDLKYHLVEDISGPQFGFGFNFMWGSGREIFRIRETKVVVSDIYPAYYQFYNLYPLALVTVENVAGYPIDINVRSYIKNYSDQPKNSGFIRIDKGETKDIPVTAIFSKNLKQVTQREPATLQLEVEARVGSKHKKEINAQIMVHTRNSWNGDMDKLGFFVTPDDERILHLSRSMLNELDAGDSTSVGNFDSGKTIFDELSKMDISYHGDPNIPFYQDDRVQYAHETLSLLSGDCDDLVVLYSSLLESVGINTAFVEVQDPAKEIAHLYLMFDSDLPAEQASLISSNEKRYVIRENPSGEKTIWVPVETTLVGKGFEEAWKTGALEYLEDGILREGITDSWVRIIDVE